MLRFLFVLALFAVATYLVVRMLQQRGVIPDRPEGQAAPRPQRPAPRRVVAPDDDEDFLRDLERKRKHRDPEE